MSLFFERLCNLCKENDTSPNAVAKKLSISSGSITAWKNGTIPRTPTISKLADFFHVSSDYLIGNVNDPNFYLDNAKILSKINDCLYMEVSPAEYEHIEKLRLLDVSGKNLINSTLEHEVERVQAISKISDLQKVQAAPALFTYPYLHRIACAGSGLFMFDDIPSDTINVPYCHGADFVIGVNGDSMEPTYYDRDMLYVKKTTELRYGDIGIFMHDGECFVKEYSKDGLVSHNPKYKIKPGNKSTRIVGKVLGRVEV